MVLDEIGLDAGCLDAHLWRADLDDETLVPPTPVSIIVT